MAKNGEKRNFFKAFFPLFHEKNINFPLTEREHFPERFFIVFPASSGTEQTKRLFRLCFYFKYSSFSPAYA